jgi:hypothetical protein
MEVNPDALSKTEPFFSHLLTRDVEEEDNDTLLNFATTSMSTGFIISLIWNYSIYTKISNPKVDLLVSKYFE